MPGFGKPRFAYEIDVARERAALRKHKKVREIPKRDRDHLLLATWNIANLGATDQKRDPECFELLAEIVGWFDLVAVQEVRDNTAAVRELLDLLPNSWQMIFSEAGGNDERFAFLWDTKVVDLGQLIGKMVIEPRKLRTAGGAGFTGFSRTPYLATFHRGQLAVELGSVHSIFGKASAPDTVERRVAETKAIAWWCEERSKDPDSYTRDILALGDFNVPTDDDSAFAHRMLDALRRKGLQTPTYVEDGDETVIETQLGSAVRSKNQYDHMFFFPKHTASDLVDCGVFDFDAVVFPDLWEARGRTDFHRYAIWAISDHRPLWMQLKAPR
jgi:hypothetical protein